jgi:hypothetical protein
VLDEKSKKSASGCPRKVFVVGVSRDFHHVAVRAASPSEKSRKLVSRCEGRAGLVPLYGTQWNAAGASGSANVGIPGFIVGANRGEDLQEANRPAVLRV